MFPVIGVGQQVRRIAQPCADVLVHLPQPDGLAEIPLRLLPEECFTSLFQVVPNRSQLADFDALFDLFVH